MTGGPGDPDLPSTARIYDYFLGGIHHFASDRAYAGEIIANYPGIVPTARANRNFLLHAVDHALDLGIRQFLDLRSGIPTVGGVHETALARDPAARVAYVDQEAAAVALSAELLAGVPTATISRAELRDPAAVLAASGVSRLLDLGRPVALLAAGAFHRVPDADDPGSIIAAYQRALAPGSLFAMSHVSEDYPDDPDFLAAFRKAVRMYGNTTVPTYARSRVEIRALVEGAGFRVNGDGLVDIGRWAPASHDGGPLGLYALITEPVGSR